MKILFVSHDASRTGAPFVLLHLLRWLKKNNDFSINLLLRKGGELFPLFEEITKPEIWYQRENNLLSKIFRKLGVQSIRSKYLIKRFKKNGPNVIYVNSVASADLIPIIKKEIDVPLILHIHELDISIKQFCGEDIFIKAIPFISHFIVVSKAVGDNLIANYSISPYKISLVHAFVPVKSLNMSNRKFSLRKELTIPQNAMIICGSGTMDWRKGVDLFIYTAAKCNSISNLPIVFVWLGGKTQGLEYDKLNYEIQKLGIENVKLLGSKPDVLDYFSQSDIFLLTSREDPFPLVCLEAASVGLPIVCFDNAGGMPEFVEDDAGVIVPYSNIDLLSAQLVSLCEDHEKRKKLGLQAKGKVGKYDVSVACPEIVKIIYEINSRHEN